VAQTVLGVWLWRKPATFVSFSADIVTPFRAIRRLPLFVLQITLLHGPGADRGVRDDVPPGLHHAA
jgi:hypothetical protein